MIVLARSFLYTILFYGWSVVMGLIMLPLLLCPRRWIVAAMRLWARGVSALLWPVCGVRVEVRGREHLTAGPLLVAAKHNCMFDTMQPFTVLDDAAFVMKQELMRIPFYGWYSAKAGMIAVDREAHAKALRGMVRQARERIAAGQQIVIFPEGTRVAPGTTGDYKPGVAALYRELGLPCTPMATNSGAHWPAHGFIRRPGKIVYQFLPPLPAGLHRGAFMRQLRETIETASAALLAEEGFTPPPPPGPRPA